MQFAPLPRRDGLPVPRSDRPSRLREVALPARRGRSISPRSRRAPTRPPRKLRRPPAAGSNLRWLPPKAADFELLDKPIVFDEAQEAVWRRKVPLVVVGSAGSGKTAVTLAKMRAAAGDVLYVTLSAYLAQTARRLYGAHGYENPSQEVVFMSFREFVEFDRRSRGRGGPLRRFLQLSGTATRRPQGRLAAGRRARIVRRVPRRDRRAGKRRADCQKNIRRSACGSPCSPPARRAPSPTSCSRNTSPG